MKSTEEAIFADAICSDGDTRGSFKFIDRQVELLGECVKNIAEHIPDIGHLIKCISNGFYTFKEKNKIYGGVNMLDVLRIKSISADVSRHIREFHKEKNYTGADVDAERVKCLKRLKSICHHHCGNHEFCEESHCAYVSISITEKLKNDVRSECTKLNDIELASNINQQYTKVSRFHGRLWILVCLAKIYYQR